MLARGNWSRNANPSTAGARKSSARMPCMQSRQVFGVPALNQNVEAAWHGDSAGVGWSWYSRSAAAKTIAPRAEPETAEIAKTRSENTGCPRQGATASEADAGFGIQVASISMPSVDAIVNAARLAPPEAATMIGLGHLSAAPAQLLLRCQRSSA